MDFNIRTDTETHYDKSVVVDETLALFLQELDIMFGTEAGSVFGNRKLGNDIERLLWKTTFNADYIKFKMTEDVKKHCFMNEYYKWSIDVKLLKGTVKDIALIDVVISDKYDSTKLATKKFQFR